MIETLIGAVIMFFGVILGSVIVRIQNTPSKAKAEIQDPEIIIKTEVPDDVKDGLRKIHMMLLTNDGDIPEKIGDDIENVITELTAKYDVKTAIISVPIAN